MARQTKAAGDAFEVMDLRATEVKEAQDGTRKVGAKAKETTRALRPRQKAKVTRVNAPMRGVMAIREM